MNIPRLALFGLFLLIPCGFASAHEVDQYVLPDCDEFEDLGDHWNEIFSTAVCKGLASLNRDIELANSIPIPAIRNLMLANYHSPGTVAWRVRKHLPIGMLAIAQFEMKLASGDIPRKSCDRIQSFRASTFSTVFSHFPLLPDPRQLGRMTILRSSVIKVHDTYIGTDKIGHFIGHGHQYYLTYRGSRKMGYCEEDAMRHAVNVGSFGPISENALVGTITTGIFSNADQAANYLGLKFFINLTEPVQLKGCIHPPMLERDGDYWVKRPGMEQKYFAAFVSEHLDEVLNPSVYTWGMGDGVRGEVSKRADKLLDWYARHDPAKRNRAYFDRVFNRCKTYFGEEYGHAGDEDELITLGDVCFADQPASGEAETAVLPASTSTANQQGFAIEVSAPQSHQLDHSEAYEIVVSNQIDEDLEYIKIVADIPKGLHVTTLAQPARFDRDASTLTWQVPAFAAGSQQAFLFIAKAVKPGTYSPKVVVRDWSRQFANATYNANVLSSTEEVYAANTSSEPARKEIRAADDAGPLEVDVLGPATHRLGELKTYEVTVFNASESELKSAEIELEIPPRLRVAKPLQQVLFDAPANTLTWRLDHVEPGTEYVLRLTAQATSEGNDAPRIVSLNQSNPFAVTAYEARTYLASRPKQATEPNQPSAHATTSHVR